MILQGDALDQLATIDDESVQCCVTSPPYWRLRDYGVPGQIGLEHTLEEYTAKLVAVFTEVRRVLKSDGICWLNLGDVYAGGGRGSDSRKTRDIVSSSMPRAIIPKGYKRKDLIGISWIVGTALQMDGWYIRKNIIWNKPNARNECVKDRPVKSHDHIFLLTKSANYYYDENAIPYYGSVWTMPTSVYKGNHRSTFPEKLAGLCIMAGSNLGDTILDPFLGTGTTGKVAQDLGREWIGIELNPEYAELAAKRTRHAQESLGLL